MSKWKEICNKLDIQCSIPGYAHDSAIYDIMISFKSEKQYDEFVKAIEGSE